MDNKEYFEILSKDFYKAYELAGKARAKGLDPKTEVEILPAPDLASRVEGLIGVKGISKIIRKKLDKQSRSGLAFEVADEICRSDEFSSYEQTKRIELAVRVGTAILTEGVLVAPTEGIKGIDSYKNPDGTSYLAISYAGPIRGAGGTAAALSVALTDYVRKIFGIDRYKPTKAEIERYVEEAELYHTRAARLQYRPPPEDIRTIVENCPVCVDGVPTESIEVSVNGNLRRIDSTGKEIPITNRVRGGISLVICEGIAQKAKKMLKETKSVGLEWEWLNGVIKSVSKKSASKEDAAVFLEELVAGRPILAYPGKSGGFRLRYGRSRLTGIASKGFNPATMVILDSFIAIGTQLRIEYPGKGCVAVPVDSIEGPFVVLKSGDAFRVNDVETALKIKQDVSEIISIGDMLATFGDFKKSNTQLQPSSYVEELWELQLKSKSGSSANAADPSFKDAFTIAVKHGIPIHPKFLYEFQTIDLKALSNLAARMSSTVARHASLFDIVSLELDFDKDTKRTLELLQVPHRLISGKIVIYEENAQSLVASLGFTSSSGIIDSVNAEKRYQNAGEAADALAFVNSVAPFQIPKRSTFIGARIGRPEKAKERLMKPALNLIFPIGTYGGNDHNLTKAYLVDSKKLKSGLKVMMANYYCPKCKRTIDSAYCHDCDDRAIILKRCQNCGSIAEGDSCEKCGSRTSAYNERTVDLSKDISIAIKNLGINKLPDVIKCLKSLPNRDKVAEPLEKGILRSKNGVFIFKDGTSRFDATDVPITHFYPSEIGVSIDKLRELNYTKDYKGNELTDPSQLVELKHQDCILSKKAGIYFTKVSRFVDQLLSDLYGLEKFYNISDYRDLIGHLVITLSPHTSCGVLNRVIGFAEVNVGLSHPYTISARRRNCDGDEDTTMLLLDALLNFSREFLPTSVGGSMDAPLVLTLNLLPEEIDDEAHAMEATESYGLEFYEKTFAYAYPSDVNVEIVEKRLGTEAVYSNIWFTHGSSAKALENSPKKSQYTQFKTMQEKVDGEFALMDRIYAIDKPDAARKLIVSHFIPDLIGNLHSFSRQNFRCSSCNSKYRRVPLSGKCSKDGGKLILTISKAGIEKYLGMAISLAERYDLDPYIKQRLVLVREEISSIFAVPEEAMKNNTTGQFNLGRYM